MEQVPTTTQATHEAQLQPRSYQQAAKFAALCFVLLSAFFSSSCDFFGKKQSDDVIRAPGDLGNGKYLLGTYSFTTAQATPTRNPTNALTTTYIFEPNGNARIELRDVHQNGVTCIGWGQYRTVGSKDVLIYIQASTSSLCGFASVTHLYDLVIKSESIEFKKENDNTPYMMFNNNVQSLAPVGLWDFKGLNGIDFILFDQYGYFLLQTTQDNAQILMLGKYLVVNGAVALQFFVEFDPTRVIGDLVIFNSFATDGQVLQLLQTTSSGNTVYTGYRL